MTNVTEITTHKQDALNRRLEQYKCLPNLEAIISIYADEIQELETVFQSLYLAHAINTAIGKQLDDVGEIVDIARPLGMTDDRYRILIFVKIGRNVSKGEIERIIQTAKLLSGAPYVHLMDLNNGNIELGIAAFFVDQAEIDFVFQNIEFVLAGGVRVTAITCFDPDEAFALSGNFVSPAGFGLDDTTDTSGGKLATHHEASIEFALAGDSIGPGGLGAGPDDPLVGGKFISVP